MLKASGGSIVMSNLILGQAAAQDYAAPPGEAQIRGTVTDKSEDPISGIEINVTPESGVAFANRITDSDGEYFFSLKPFNTYTVSVNNEGYKEFTYSVSVGSGEGFIVDIELTPLLPAQNGLAINDGTVYLVEDSKIKLVSLNTRSVIDRFDAPDGRPRGLAYGNSSLWFADGVEPDFDGEILELDTETGEVRSRIDTSYDPRGLAFGEDSLWVIDITSNDIEEYSPNGRRVGGFDIRGPTDVTFGRGLAYFDGSLWVGEFAGSDGLSTASLYEFTTDGEFVQETGKRSFPPGEGGGYGGLATTSTELLGPDEDGNLTVLRTLGESPPPGSPEGSILGTVTDSAGNQLADVTIEFINDSGTTVKSIKTDTDGSYETTLPADATYDVTVVKDGFQSETKQVTIIQSETKTIDFSLEELAELTIKDARLVQIVENTRIDGSPNPPADEDKISSSVNPDTPDLILGRNTTVVFDIAGPTGLSLTDDVEVKISGDNVLFASSGDGNSRTYTINGSVISDVVSYSSLIDEFAKRPDSDLDIMLTRGSYPFFEASRDISEVKVEINPQEDRVSGDSVTLTRGSGTTGDFEFTQTPPLSIGFIPVDDYAGTREYGQMDSEEYNDAIRKSVKYVQKVFPTTEIYFYTQSYSDGVQALAAPAPGSDEDSIVGDVAEGISNVAISRDMTEARFELDRQTPTENIRKISKANIVDSNQEIEQFDFTIAIVPSDYFSQLNIDAGGLHFSSLGPIDAVQPRICACADVDTIRDRDGSTVMHEAGHHFLGDPFTGDLAQDTARDDPPNPPSGRQGSDPAHAQDNLVSTKFDIPIDDSTVLTSLRFDSGVSSYMSYVSSSSLWADTVSTQKLIEAADLDGFSPTPPEDPIELLPGADSLVIIGEILDGDIEISFADTLNQSVRTAGVEEGVDIQISGNDGSNLANQTLPRGIRATFAEGEKIEPPIIGENVIIGDIAFPAETSEVEITAPSPGSNDENITKTIDTSSPVIADFSLSTEPAVANEPIEFDAGSSFVKSSGEIIESYEWDWTDDGSFETETNIPTTSHTYNETGVHTVTLRVTDDEGNTATTSQTIQVVNSKGDTLLELYANDAGIIDRNGLSNAVDDWVAQDINTDLLRQAIDAWRTGEPVE